MLLREGATISVAGAEGRRQERWRQTGWLAVKSLKYAGRSVATRFTLISAAAGHWMWMGSKFSTKFSLLIKMFFFCILTY